MKVVCLCPKCGTVYIIDEVRVGRRARCAKCGEKFVLDKKTREEVSQAPKAGADVKKPAGPSFRADPLVLKVLDAFPGQFPFEPDEKVLNFVSTEADPENVRAGLVLTTGRLFYFDSRQEINMLLKDINTVRFINPAVERPERFAGLTNFGHAGDPKAVRLQINDNLFCLRAPRHLMRRLVKNLAIAKNTRILVQATCTRDDIVFIEQTEKGITIEVPTGAPVEFPDECARCGSPDAQENFHVRAYYIPYCEEHHREDRGMSRKGCAVKVVKAKKRVTRLLFARPEYAHKFISLNTGMPA
ncbi:MAG: hypothetical protein ABIH04_05155 [Planctomycetota bacterium]